MRRLTNIVFLCAVMAINFTLLRPSPVDILFVGAMALSLISGQVLTRNLFLLFCLLGTWLGSLYVSSLTLTDDPEVTLFMIKITYAVSIGFCAGLVAVHWREIELRRFLQVYVAATCVAATLGMIGFVTGSEALTWDGRAKGLLDDPNMYGAFLLPGIVACMYFLSQRERTPVYLAALGWIVLGLLASFSRAAIVSGLLWASCYYVFLNRRNLAKAGFLAFLVVAAIAAAAILASVFVDGFAEKLADRSTIAKDYDLGHGGRYSRYAMSIPFILDNPLGMGLLEINRYFDEPIHNIFISSFLNYGWAAGLAFFLLLLLSVSVSLSNYRATRNEITLAVFFCWLAVVSCSFLHETERWRHLWLMTGLVWGLNARHFVRPALDGARGAAERRRAVRGAAAGGWLPPEPGWQAR